MKNKLFLIKKDHILLFEKLVKWKSCEIANIYFFCTPNGAHFIKFTYTFDENIIGAPKCEIIMVFKMLIFPILYFSLLLPIKLSLFQISDRKSCHSEPLCFIIKWAFYMTSFLYCFLQYICSYHSSNYRYSNDYGSFLLKRL